MLSTPLAASALIVLALVLLAWEASRSTRDARIAGFALLLLLVGGSLRVSLGPSLFDGAVETLVSLGVGFMVASVVLALRKTSPRSFFILGILVLALAGFLQMAASMLQGRETEQALLVELGPDDRIEEITPTLDRYEARYEQAFPTVTLAMDIDLAQVYLLYVPAGSAEALIDALRLDRENVDDIAVNRAIGLAPPVEVAVTETTAGLAQANDPLAAEQWALDLSRGHAAHALLREIQPARKARVAIIDTGVDGAHEDLAPTFRDSPGRTDQNGHGTHCAGIAGAATNNGLGMASLNWEGRFVEVAGYPALNAAGMGTLESVAQSIIDAAQDEVDVISLSLGDYAPTPPKVLADAVAFAQERGVILVASAGNSNRDAWDHVPSNLDGVIAVAAVDAQGRKATFSNTIASLNRPIAAPGVNIVSLVPSNGYAPKSGTSMAAPFVSGLVGILRALDPNLTVETAYDVLNRTGIDVDDSYQIGRVVDAEAAIRTVLEGDGV